MNSLFWKPNALKDSLIYLCFLSKFIPKRKIINIKEDKKINIIFLLTNNKINNEEIKINIKKGALSPVINIEKIISVADKKINIFEKLFLLNFNILKVINNKNGLNFKIKPPAIYSSLKGPWNLE